MGFKEDTQVMDTVKMIEKTYDSTPYLSNSYGKTWPGRQKTVLQFLGFHAPEIETARVLEIGCSFGGNIIPFALTHPKAKVIGVDLSEVQVKEGNRIIKLLGLDNIELWHKNIMDFDDSCGMFDYIICHGVFSWVPSEAQEGILDVIDKHLVKNGSAVVSYNTYPGWKDLDVLKDLMRFRVEALRAKGKNIEPTELAGYGRGAVEYLRKMSATMTDHCKIFIDSVINNLDDYYIQHEFFECVNQAIYLYDFNKKLLQHKLFHVIDAVISTSFPSFKDAESREMILRESENDHVVREQYYDYVVNQQFRQSIITHLENKKKCNLSTLFQIDDIKGLHIRGHFSKNEEGKYIDVNKAVFVDELSNILEKLNTIYPDTVKVEEFVNMLNADDERGVYQGIINLIYENQIEVYSEKVKIKKAEKLKLNKKYRKYIEYILNTENPVISLAAFNGNVLHVSRIEMEMMLLFDGKRTDKDIADIIKKNAKNEGNEKEIEEVVGNVHAFLENLLMNE